MDKVDVLSGFEEGTAPGSARPPTKPPVDIFPYTLMAPSAEIAAAETRLRTVEISNLVVFEIIESKQQIARYLLKRMRLGPEAECRILR
jgi:hypothetical protein